MSTTNVIEESDLISQRAEIFRSQLITDFHLLESISEGGSRIEAPNLYTVDVTDPVKCHKMMLNRPHGLVRFHIYDNEINLKITSAERRRNRLVNKRKRNPPLDLWANYVVSSNWFQNFILALILINSVILGIQAEISAMEKTPTIEMLSLILDIFDYIALLCFLIEIFLKWIDNFKAFWKNRWNIFDFLVTFLSLIPEIIKYSTNDSAVFSSDITVVVDNLRTFRVLRSLKMVSRFQKVRLIVLAVTKAFHEMVFITLLLFIFAYIFAIVGVLFLNYDDYQDQLIYKNSFSSFLEALVTLFQLFTLDHWIDVYTDVRTVAGQVFAVSYVIVWIIIGSFIIRNIVVGIMVNNFQSIRNELFQEVGEIQDREQRDMEMTEFAEELDRQNFKKEDHAVDELSGAQFVGASGATAQPMMEDEEDDEGSNTRLYATESKFASKEELKNALDQNVNKMERESEEWQQIVENNLENLSKEEATFCWPRDSLFKYYLMLETLQENIKERQELLCMACECVSMLQDK